MLGGWCSDHSRAWRNASFWRLVGHDKSAAALNFLIIVIIRGVWVICGRGWRMVTWHPTVFAEKGKGSFEGVQTAW